MSDKKKIYNIILKAAIAAGFILVFGLYGIIITVKIKLDR